MTEKSLPDFSRAMIALLPDESDRSFIWSRVSSAFEDTSSALMPPGLYHITIANLGPLTIEDVANIQHEFQNYMWDPKRVRGSLGGVGYFTPDDEPMPVMYINFDSKQINEIELECVHALARVGVKPDTDHGFTPHLTIAHGHDTERLANLDFQNQTLIFNRLYLVVDDIKIPLGESNQEKYMEASGPMKSYELSPEGDLWIYVYGVPFHGPEFLGGKDLAGEYFDEHTDIGPLEKVLSYWDHGKTKDEYDPVYSKVREFFGNDPIGVAEKVAKDENGWVYRVIVDRRKKYLDLLKQLADARMLAASSTPFHRGAEKDADGHWSKWHVVEVTLTPTPEGPNATQYLEKALKDILGESMAKKQNTGQEPEKDTDLEATDETEIVETSGGDRNSLVDDLEKVFSDKDNDDEETNNEASDSDVTLEKVFTAIEHLGSQFEALVNIVGEVKGDQETIQKDVDDIRLAFPVLAQHVKDTVAKGVRSTSQSPSERDAEDILREKMQKRQSQTPNKPRANVAYLPPTAPGLN
jgi:2'-5' RNA ligase